MDVIKIYFNIVLLVIVQVTAVIGGECCLSYVALDGFYSGSFWCPNVCCYQKRQKPLRNSAHALIDFRSRECCDDPDLQVYSYERDTSCTDWFFQEWYYYLKTGLKMAIICLAAFVVTYVLYQMIIPKRSSTVLKREKTRKMHFHHLSQDLFEVRQPFQVPKWHLPQTRYEYMQPVGVV
ncbi:uncharacterized protein LOC128228867 [Mya arenaria]|uniref:uncharacterized protein LOC128228867 n=1 Tax=Mya arenaria TaxID=6604 RepID=UPI0022E1862A|nr:uncharacterized protein LOC128228867 [Mya arenaria]